VQPDPADHGLPEEPNEKAKTPAAVPKKEAKTPAAVTKKKAKTPAAVTKKKAKTPAAVPKKVAVKKAKAPILLYVGLYSYIFFFGSPVKFRSIAPKLLGLTGQVPFDSPHKPGSTYLVFVFLYLYIVMCRLVEWGAARRAWGDAWDGGRGYRQKATP
jgi:hypothetical protein